MSRKCPGEVYISDFGLIKIYRDRNRGIHSELVSAVLSSGSKQQSLLLSFKPQNEGKYLFDEVVFELLGVRFRYSITALEFECIGPQPLLTVVDMFSPDLTHQYIHGEL